MKMVSTFKNVFFKPNSCECQEITVCMYVHNNKNWSGFLIGRKHLLVNHIKFYRCIIFMTKKKD